MKTIDYRFNLDLHAEGAQTIKNVQRGDNYVKLIVTFSEEGKPYPLSGIATVKFAALKADGNYIYDNTQIVNNSVEFVLTGQCTAAAGLMVCQFKLIDGSGHIKASPTFALNICENAYDEQPIVESSDEFNALTTYVAQLQAMLANHEFDGESAYELAVDAGYVGTVEQWLASLKGDKGDPGDIEDIDPDELVQKIHGKINPQNTGSGTYGYKGQYGINSENKPVVNLSGAVGTWTELAKASDLSGKADAATTLGGYGITDAYTKAGVNELIVGLNAAKADKSETYTKNQVDNLISAVSTLSFEVVQTLPTTDIKTNVIYLLPKQTPATGNIYEEWAYINSNWELLGTTDIDISGKADKATTLAGYGITDAYTKTEVNTALSGKADTADIPDISGKMDLAPSVSPSGIGAVASGQIFFSTGGVAIKTNSGYIELEKAGNKVDTIYASSTDTQYPSAKAVYDFVSDIDVSSAIKRYIGETEPPTQPIQSSQVVPLPCIWYYNGSAWFIYGKEGTGTAGYWTYSMVKLAMYDDLPDLSTKEDKSNKVEQVQSSLSTTQYPSIKAMTTYVTLGLSYKEATANRVTSINSSSDNSHYPTAAAVKSYVDTAIGNIETALSEV